MAGNRNISESPFHIGEQEVQERLGVREKIEAFAKRVVRDHLPQQHREFYEMLPFIMLGTVDKEGQPWASIMPGRPGFITSPDAQELEINAAPLWGDPIRQTLRPGADVGMLGIQLEARRRNRVTGKIKSYDGENIQISIGQTFGNCPQYIQTRAVEIMPEIDQTPQERPVNRADHFDDDVRAIIEKSDTLFIATAYTEDPGARSQGADVSHRGGKPGFVKVVSDRKVLFPDFSGNNHYNTVGNITLNPKAGLLFIDFDTGDLVYMTGKAEIIWDSEEVSAFGGAERFIGFEADEVIRVAASLPLRFDFNDYSPMLEHTGSWLEARATIAADKTRNSYIPFEVFNIEAESDVITSFYLRPANGAALVNYEPGQFLPIRLSIPGSDGPLNRTYTVSDAPNSDHYRLSIKREGGDAQVSNHFHDQLKSGDIIEAMAPRGKFVLDQTSNRPVVLLSAGVGITPMIAMTNFIYKEGLRTREFRRTYFIHAAQNGSTHAFGGHIRELAETHDFLDTHFCYSQPDANDRLGHSHDSEGFVGTNLLKQILPLDDYDFYLCGPSPFMQSLFDGLTELGIRETRIHYESFGPATVLKHDQEPQGEPDPGEIISGPVQVKFANSDVNTEWSPDKGTLLELAEAAGLNPEFSCRSGVCGTCATRLKCGAVDYIEEPSAPHAPDEVLICCCTPRSSIGKTSCGKDNGVVLDL